MASGEEVSSKPAKETMKILNTTISVAEPSKRTLRDGQILLCGHGSSRSSSGASTSSSNTWIKAELCLTKNAMHYSIEDIGTCEMLLEDVIGIQLTKTPPASKPRACEFSIYLYPVVNPQAKTKSRLQCTVVIHFDSSEKFEDNFESASKWKTAVLLQTQRAVRATFGEDNADQESSSQSNLEAAVLVPRRFLVIISPMSGYHKSEMIFKQCVQPMLDLADIQYIVEVTKYKKHAQELLKIYDLKEIDSIVILAGDGTINEAINGIMERADWDMAVKIPIGVIPTGSGNCLSLYTFMDSGEKMGPEMAAFQIIRGGVISIDLAIIQLSDGTSRYSILAASRGLTSDFIAASEKFRKFGLGYARYYLASVSVIARMKRYSGKLSYLPANPKILPQLDVSDAVHEDIGEASTSGGAESCLDNKSTTQRQAPLPRTDLLVPLTEPVPDTWVTKEGNFHLCGAALRPAIAFPLLGCFVDTSIPFEAGSLRLMWTGEEFSRSTATKIISGSPEVTTNDESKFVRVNVKAFRLEPETAPGNMTVDGDLVTYGPMQGQVHQGLIHVMSRKRKT